MPSKLQKLEKQIKAYYKTIHRVYCPYFEEEIAFNSQGFNHLLYVGPYQRRSAKDRFLRLKLFHLAPQMLKKAAIVQEYEERSSQGKITIYWGFIGILDGYKIKVVIRQKGANGSKHFYSFYPNWITRKISDTKKAPVYR